MPTPIDTTNYSMVTAHDGKVLVMIPIPNRLTPAEARQFAAWLVVMSECAEVGEAKSPTFEQVVDAVRNC